MKWAVRYKEYPSGGVETSIVFLPVAGALQMDEHTYELCESAEEAEEACRRFYDSECVTREDGVTILKEGVKPT